MNKLSWQGMVSLLVYVGGFIPALIWIIFLDFIVTTVAVVISCLVTIWLCLRLSKGRDWSRYSSHHHSQIPTLTATAFWMGCFLMWGLFTEFAKLIHRIKGDYFIYYTEITAIGLIYTVTALVTRLLVNSERKKNVSQ